MVKEITSEEKLAYEKSVNDLADNALRLLMKQNLIIKNFHKNKVKLIKKS